MNIRFNGSWRMYGPGDVASFPPEVAERLCEETVIKDGITVALARRAKPEEETAKPQGALPPPEMLDVVLLQDGGPYNAGDCASFHEPLAKRMIREGAARAMRPEDDIRLRHESPAPEVKTVIVRLLEDNGNYNQGDVISLPSEVAERAVSIHGIAEYHEEEPPGPPVKKRRRGRPPKKQPVETA